MDFQLNEPAPGIFEIVRSVPQTVGTFEDRSIAEKVLGFLEADAANAARAAQVAAAGSETKEAAPEPIQIAKAEQKPKTAAPKKPAPVPPANSDVAHFSWSDDELAEAFERLVNGEKIKVVADSFKKSWTALRAKWAVHQKAGAETATPHQKVTGAISELMNKTPCDLCGAPFTPSVENTNLCARCRREL